MNRKSRQLVKNLRSDDGFLRNSALIQIEKIYFPALRVFLFNHGNITEEDCEDILQETLIRIDQKFDSYNQSYALSTWIYRIARNLALNQNRTLREAAPFSSLDFDQIESPIQLPEQSAIKREESRFIQDFLYSCTPREKDVAFLYYYEEMKQKEIALVLDVAEGTVKSLLSRVRTKLKEIWNEKME